MRVRHLSDGVLYWASFDIPPKGEYRRMLGRQQVADWLAAREAYEARWQPEGRQPPAYPAWMRQVMVMNWLERQLAAYRHRPLVGEFLLAAGYEQAPAEVSLGLLQEAAAVVASSGPRHAEVPTVTPDEYLNELLPRLKGGQADWLQKLQAVRHCFDRLVSLAALQEQPNQLAAAWAEYLLRPATVETKLQQLQEERRPGSSPACALQSNVLERARHVRLMCRAAGLRHSMDTAAVVSPDSMWRLRAYLVGRATRHGPEGWQAAFPRLDSKAARGEGQQSETQQAASIFNELLGHWGFTKLLRHGVGGSYQLRYREQWYAHLLAAAEAGGEAEQPVQGAAAHGGGGGGGNPAAARPGPQDWSTTSDWSSSSAGSEPAAGAAPPAPMDWVSASDWSSSSADVNPSGGGAAGEAQQHRQ